MLARGGENAQQLRGVEDRGRSSAEVNGIGALFDDTPQLRRQTARAVHILDEAGNVILVSRLREHVGGEVAVAALGPAKRDGNVEAEGHAVVILWEASRSTVA